MPRCKFLEFNWLGLPSQGSGHTNHSLGSSAVTQVIPACTIGHSFLPDPEYTL
jgi:hypothetical protein